MYITHSYLVDLITHLVYDHLRPICRPKFSPPPLFLRFHPPHMYSYLLVTAPAGTECGSRRRRQNGESSPKLTEVFAKLWISF